MATVEEEERKKVHHSKSVLLNMKIFKDASSLKDMIDVEVLKFNSVFISIFSLVISFPHSFLLKRRRNNNKNTNAFLLFT